jgi:hypothetical protein
VADLMSHAPVVTFQGARSVGKSTVLGLVAEEDGDVAPIGAL